MSGTITCKLPVILFGNACETWERWKKVVSNSFHDISVWKKMLNDLEEVPLLADEKIILFSDINRFPFNYWHLFWISRIWKFNPPDYNRKIEQGNLEDIKKDHQLILAGMEKKWWFALGMLRISFIPPFWVLGPQFEKSFYFPFYEKLIFWLPELIMARKYCYDNVGVGLVSHLETECWSAYWKRIIDPVYRIKGYEKGFSYIEFLHFLEKKYNKDILEILLGEEIIQEENEKYKLLITECPRFQ